MIEESMPGVVYKEVPTNKICCLVICTCTYVSFFHYPKTLEAPASALWFFFPSFKERYFWKTAVFFLKRSVGAARMTSRVSAMGSLVSYILNFARISNLPK